MAINLEGIVTWLKGWFYEKSEVNTLLNAKVNQNQGQANYNVVTDSNGNITVEEKPVIPDVSGKIDTAGTGLSKSGTTLNHSNSVPELTTSGLKKIKHDAQGHITETANPNTSDLPNSETYANLGSNLTNQKLINDAINTKIGALTGIEFIVITTNKGTASADTMNKLYVVSENSKVNYYYTKRSGTSPNYTYSWEELDANIVADVSWNSVTGKPSTFTPSSHNHEADEVYDDNYQLYTALINIGLLSGSDQQSMNTAIDHAISSHDSTLQSMDSAISGKASTSHTHGNLTNDGKVGSSSGKIITTTTGGAIQASDSITKSMISDFPTSMTPSSHTHGQVTNDGKITSTAVTVASGDNIIITDASDSSKIKRVANLLVSHIKDSSGEAGKLLVTGSGGTVTATTDATNYISDPNPHSNINTTAYSTQSTINSAIDTALSGKASASDVITSIALVPKSTDANGKIIFYTGDEPT